MTLMFLLDLVDLQNLLELQLQHLRVLEKEWNAGRTHVSGYLDDLHHPQFSQSFWMMTIMISHHKKKGNRDGLDRVS